MPEHTARILVTNDDGIDSPGLWAAVDALAPLGEIWICAPRTQSTSSGRSMPPITDGKIERRTITYKGKEWQAFSIGATPAQVVLYSLFEIMPVKPDLVVSGINYGANTGSDITRSGTVGAALEAASHGIPAMAVSQQVAEEETFTHSERVDFSTAGFFSAFFARQCLSMTFGEDVHVLKIEVPTGATPGTPWQVVRSTPASLYLVVPPRRSDWTQPNVLKYRMETDYTHFAADTDSYVVFVKKMVAVTPLSLDLTSRIDLKMLEKQLHSEH
ncbi:MAG TPA: 5'/3'-nucleotidase SurE [Longilinea sp.]|nr:5'/3'-nucleotidase SurE [Longilinea sp.]